MLQLLHLNYKMDPRGFEVLNLLKPQKSFMDFWGPESFAFLGLMSQKIDIFWT